MSESEDIDTCAMCERTFVDDEAGVQTFMCEQCEEVFCNDCAPIMRGDNPSYCPRCCELNASKPTKRVET